MAAVDKYISKTAAKIFDNENHSSALMLNAMLPLLADIAHAKRMPSEIQNQLNRLRGRRNKIVQNEEDRKQTEPMPFVTSSDV
jgi:phosphopantothenoylcysteine synthetase/decarboxylase